jgi:hypothetical protein
MGICEAESFVVWANAASACIQLLFPEELGPQNIVIGRISNSSRLFIPLKFLIISF